MTLGEYRDFAVRIYGEESGAVKFVDAKIAKQGRDEKVIAPESQMLYLLDALNMTNNKRA